MAAGVPVVVARAASLPEVCGDAALYFDPLSVEEMANRMLEIVSCSGLRNRMVSAGIERSRQFSWESCGARTAEGLSVCLDVE